MTAPVDAVLPTMLQVIEARLSDAGELPRFREIEPGLLRHQCLTVEAVVNFWPGALT